MPLELLDEKGFVFLGGQGRPYWCRLWDGAPWLFYWHPDDHWVSLRPTTQAEIWQFPRNLKQEWQDLYHRQHANWVLRHKAQIVPNADEQ